MTLDVAGPVEFVLVHHLVPVIEALAEPLGVIDHWIRHEGCRLVAGFVQHLGQGLMLAG